MLISSVSQIIITFRIHVNINGTADIRGYFIRLEKEMYMPVSIEVELPGESGQRQAAIKNDEFIACRSLFRQLVSKQLWRINILAIF